MYFYTDCNLRYLDKDQNECILGVVSNWWDELIANYGQIVLYYVSNFSLSAQDETYGEDTPAGFQDPRQLVAMCSLTQAQLFAKWGLMSDDFTTFVVHITAFRNVFGASSEPKSGDVFQLIEFGNDRPSPRDGKMFQITERSDEDITQTNQLMGHFVWFIKAKRYEYTFEPNISAEKGQDQVYDNTFFGRLSGYENPQTSTKTYPGSANDQYSPTIFDYKNDGASEDTEYGGYL